MSHSRHSPVTTLHPNVSESAVSFTAHCDLSDSPKEVASTMIIEILAHIQRLQPFKEFQATQCVQPSAATQLQSDEFRPQRSQPMEVTLGRPLIIAVQVQPFETGEGPWRGELEATPHQTQLFQLVCWHTSMQLVEIVPLVTPPPPPPPPPRLVDVVWG